MLTGLKPEPSLKLRTKDNADHAGHSQPLEVLKVSANSLMVNSKTSQSNNLLTAQARLATKPATEV